MKGIKIADIPMNLKNKVIKKWRFGKLNTIPEIAKTYNLKKGTVNAIINQYLSEKAKMKKT